MTLSEQPSSNECKSVSLYSWAAKNGITIRSGLEIRRTTSRGLGIFASSHVGAGEVLLRVPQSRLINADNIEKSSDIGDFVGPLRSAGLDDRGVLVLWILSQFIQPNSEWRPYFTMLPSEYELSRQHLLLSEDDISGTPVAMAVQRMRENITRQSNSVLKALKRLGAPKPFRDISSMEWEGLWRLAHTLVLSRSSQVSSQKHFLEWTDEPICILPVVDFCNHSDAPNAKLIECEDGSFNLIALRSISASEEVLISYWPEAEPLACEQSLFSYGFLSSYDRFAFAGIDLSQTGEKNPRYVIQKLILMDHRSSESGNPVIFLDEMDAILDFFTVKCMDHRKIDALIRCYVAEGGLGSQSRAILNEARPAAKLELRRILHGWKDQALSCRAKTATVSEYIARLDKAIDATLKKLDFS